MEISISETSSTLGEEIENSNLVEQFSSVMVTISSLKTQVSALQNQIKGLERGVKKEMKVLRKEATKTKVRGNRKPSGFAKPSKISDELCKFMNKDSGTKVARTEVTQYLIGYIKDKNLQYAENRKVINPDGALKKLLGVEDQEELTYFNLQKYMNQHFLKEEGV
tara:strand:- start:404 stop:898 length:495 start_codon:yes stop_codon:yes gene_type:complete